MRRLLGTVATLSLAASATLVRAEPASTSPQPSGANSELEPMTVTPLGDPFEQAEERLRERMENLPCLGCGPDQEAARRDAYGVIGRFLAALTGLPAEPPNPDREQRIEYRVAEDWRVSEHGPEMEAFR